MKMEKKQSLTILAVAICGLVLLAGFMTIPQILGTDPIESDDPSMPIFTVSSNASTRYYTDEELKEESDLIVQGKLIKIDKAKWSTPNGKQPKGAKITESLNEYGDKVVEFECYLQPGETIYTDITFEIEKYYKGEKSESNEVIIRIFGGTVGHFHMNDASFVNSEDYKEGEEYLLFLLEESEGRGPTSKIGPKHYLVLSARGKLSLSSEGELVNPYGEKVDLKDLN
jgi:hypothetical protein